MYDVPGGLRRGRGVNIIHGSLYLDQSSTMMCPIKLSYVRKERHRGVAIFTSVI